MPWQPERVVAVRDVLGERYRFARSLGDRPALRAGVTEPTRQDGFHALRHLYASVLPDVGESVKALSEYLG